MTERAMFEPEWASPPGATIARILDREKISVDDFAWELEISRSEVIDLCKGSLPINEEIAKRLEQVLRVSSDFWLEREAQYRGDCLKLAQRIPPSEGKAWLRKLPKNEMLSMGWVRHKPTEVEQLSEYLRFFDVSSIEHYERRITQIAGRAKFRTSETFKSEPNALGAWLRFGEIEARSIECSAWSVGKLRAAIPELRKLTLLRRPDQFIPKLQSICAKAGVAVVIAKAPKGCRASGATMFLSKEKALLLLSFRHLSDDHFWFSFFHECGHLILHPQEMLIVEGETAEDDPFEQEANQFASEVLIPPPWKQFLLTLRPNRENIIRFSVRCGVSPGIVVGQLQHNKRISHNYLNFLKRRYRWD